MTDSRRLRRIFWDAIRPDALVSVSEWADEHCYLTSETSAFPGRFKTSRLPFAKEPMDRLSPSDPCVFVVCMFASQMSKTRIGLNWTGRSMHKSPAPMLIVQPTVEKAKEFAKHRFDTMVGASPALRGLVADAKSRDGSNTMTYKTFPGGVVRFAGGNSPASVASTPCRYVWVDECDNVSEEAGGQGDTADQAIQRTAAFPNRKVLLTGTPTFKGLSRMETWFQAGDQNRFWVPCPHCGAFQVLVWKQLKYEKGPPVTAYYECEHCEEAIENRHKTWMLPLGEWRPDNPDASGKIRSYHINALYTPHGWPNDFAELARLWIAAHKDNVKRKAFINLKLGETWDPFRAGGVSHDYLHNRSTQLAEEFGICLDERGHEYDAGVPDDAVLLTCAVDVQADRLEVEVKGWGVGEEQWSIDYRRMEGDLSAPAVWNDLDEYLGREWVTVSGWTMSLERTCIDSGGHYTQQVYDFVKGKRSRYIRAIKGLAGPRPIWNPKPSKSQKGGALFYQVGVDAAKEMIYSRLRLDVPTRPGTGFIHHPRGRSLDYFKSLTAERMEKVVYAGQMKIRWICPPRTPNEGLDLAVYNYAAYKSWAMAGYSLEARRAARASKASGVDEKPSGRQGGRKRPVPGTGGSDWLEGVPGEDWMDGA